MNLVVPAAARRTARAATANARGDTTPSEERLAEGAARSERLQAIGSEAARIVHELNLPASLITGGLDNLEQYIGVLVRNAGGSPDGRATAEDGDQANLAYAVAHVPEMLRICRDGADRLGRLALELRAFVRGQGAVTAPMEARIAGIVAGAVSSATLARPGARRVRVHQDLRAATVLLGNPEALERAFANLIGNALDAVDGRSDPQIWVQSREKTDGSAAEPSWVEIRIRDNGPGIAPSDRERIFEAFFTTKARGGGLGLGLAIAHDAIAAHGGEILAAESSQGGALFIVRLPRLRPT